MKACGIITLKMKRDFKMLKMGQTHNIPVSVWNRIRLKFRGSGLRLEPDYGLGLSAQAPHEQLSQYSAPTVESV